MNKNSPLKGYIYVILSAVIFGCMPLMAKLIYEEGVDPLGLVFLRNALSIPMLALVAALLGQSFRVKPRSLPSIGIIGIMGCAVTPFLLFSSYQYMASGTATVLHFVYPAAVVLLELVFLRNGIRWGNILSLALCIAGIAMFYTPGAEMSLVGSVIALLSGVTYAIYIFLLGIFRDKSVPGFVFSFYIASVSAVGMLAVCLFTGGISFPSSPRGWLLCLAFALAVNVGAVFLFQRGTFIIGGERASILSTVEPITSIVVGIIVFSEPASWRTVVGAVLVIAASVLIAVFDMIRKRKG